MAEVERLTPEEMERAGELTTGLLSSVAMLARAYPDEELELVERGLVEMANGHSFMDAASVVYMAMGVDVYGDPRLKRERRNIDLVRKAVALLRDVRESAVQELADEDEAAKREAIRESLGF